MRPAAALAFFVVLAFTSSPIAAQEDDGRARATDLAERAQDELLEGDAKEALELARQAEAAHHAPTILLLMARAQMALGLHVDAVKTYDRILSERLAADARPEFKIAQELAQRERNELYARVGLVEVDVKDAPKGVEIVVAGEKVQGVGPHAVAAGEVTVDVTAPGHQPFSGRVAVRVGERKRLDVELVEEAGSSVDSAFEEMARTPAPTILAFSIAGGLALAGAVSGGLAVARKDELDERCVNKRCAKADQALADEAGALADASTATLAAAGVLATAGAFVLAVSQGGTRWGEARVEARVGPFFTGVTGEF